MPFKAKPIAERLMASVEKTEGCWLWTGARGKHGYGIITLAPHHRTGRVHRIMWELHNGQIPEGMCVCHRCDNPVCVKLDHLFLGTHADNVRDRIAKGRSRYPNTLKTHCKRGHEFSPANTYRTKDGRRDCRACWQVRSRNEQPHKPAA